MEKIVSQAFILLILFILLNSIQSVTANSETKSNLNQSDSNIKNNETISAFNNFNQQNDFNWEIKWNNKTGTPKTLYKFHSSQLTGDELKGNPEDIARGFLSKHSNLFLMKKDLADLRISQISRGLASDHIRFIQTYNDLTVYGAETSVHMNKDGQIELINNNYQPQINILNTDKNISKEKSISRAIQYLNPDSKLRAEVNTELVVYPKKNSHYLAWKVL